MTIKIEFEILLRNFGTIFRVKISESKIKIHEIFSWLSCSPYQLEQKIVQFSAATFIIEKFADYAEEAGFTQNLINYAIRVLRFGLPTRAILPFTCALSRLVLGSKLFLSGEN